MYVCGVRTVQLKTAIYELTFGESIRGLTVPQRSHKQCLLSGNQTKHFAGLRLQTDSFKIMEDICTVCCYLVYVDVQEIVYLENFCTHCL